MKDDIINGCFPRVHKLYELALLIPHSTAVVESGFSVMNDTCTILRFSLRQRSLDVLIRVYSMSTTVTNYSDDYLNVLIDEFKTKKNREMLLHILFKFSSEKCIVVICLFQCKIEKYFTE